MTGEAFAQAVQTYGDTVYRVAFHALNNREDAEDVMQTVMLKLFEYDKEFESEAHLKHWLLRAELLEAVMALDPKYRLAIYLYYYEGLTVAETAAAMRANPSTVQTWLLRARARLRSALDEKAEDQEGSVYVRPQGIL